MKLSLEKISSLRHWLTKMRLENEALIVLGMLDELLQTERKTAEDKENLLSTESLFDNSKRGEVCNIKGLSRDFSSENKIVNFNKLLVKPLWEAIRDSRVTHDSLANRLYASVIRYSDFSKEEQLLAKNIMSSKKYRDWVSEFDPGDMVSFDVENKKFWSKIKQIDGVKSVDYNPSGHAEISFDYKVNQVVPARKTFQDIKLKQDLYFTFELSQEAKDSSDASFEAIKNYLKWILRVIRYAADTNSYLKKQGSSGYIRGLKFNYGVSLNLLGGSIFDENDTLKIYFANVGPDFLKSFYDNVLRLKDNYSGFTINKNRKRKARGFDLSNIPTHGSMSFGQILGYRMAYHLMNNISCIQSLSDDNNGKKEFLNILGNVMNSSEYELIKAMDAYTKGEQGGSERLEVILRESKIL